MFLKIFKKKYLPFDVSFDNLTNPLSKTSLNAGHPQPESYFVSDENNSNPQTIQL